MIKCKKEEWWGRVLQFEEKFWGVNQLGKDSGIPREQNRELALLVKITTLVTRDQVTSSLAFLQFLSAV